MKLSRNDDGTLVADFQGLDGSRLQLTVANFLEKLKKGEVAEILMDDPDTHESIVIATREQGCRILQNKAEGGTFRIKFKK
jgi:TusA-related sulfurtransferase